MHIHPYFIIQQHLFGRIYISIEDIQRDRAILISSCACAQPTKARAEQEVTSLTRKWPRESQEVTSLTRKWTRESHKTPSENMWSLMLYNGAHFPFEKRCFVARAARKSRQRDLTVRCAHTNIKRSKTVRFKSGLPVTNYASGVNDATVSKKS